MRLFPDTIAGRTTAVLLAGLVLLHLASVWAYELGIASEIDYTNEARVAERLLSIRRAISDVAPRDRERLAHSLSGGALEVHWSATPLTVSGEGDDPRSRALRGRLTEAAPDLAGTSLLIGIPAAIAAEQSDPHIILLSMRLGDGSWINYSMTRLTGPHASLLGVVLSTSLLALGVLAASAYLLRAVTRPLRQCADAAERLYVDPESKAIAVAGPREVRGLASALNGLQARVKRLIDERTLTLAAISHDLKTPLARMRLRAEAIADDGLRSAVERDLAEMQSMIDGTLDFLRGDQVGEELRRLDLATLLETICADLTDAGHQVTLACSGDLVLTGRHLALKRAFGNLIGNAVIYGTSARVTASGAGERIVVTIEDRGPGIPREQREAVFAPFYRLEQSRNRETGGVGLGLTVARSVIRGHGGEIELADGEQQGLVIRIMLPRAGRETAGAAAG